MRFGCIAEGARAPREGFGTGEAARAAFKPELYPLLEGPQAAGAAKRVAVETRGGELLVSWAGPGAPVMMTGPAVTVFEGEIVL